MCLDMCMCFVKCCVLGMCIVFWIHVLCFRQMYCALETCTVFWIHRYKYSVLDTCIVFCTYGPP